VEWAFGFLLAGIFMVLPVVALIVALRALVIARGKQGSSVGIEERLSTLERRVEILRRAVRSAPAATPPSVPSEQTLTSTPISPAQSTSVRAEEPSIGPTARVASPPETPPAAPKPTPIPLASAPPGQAIGLEHRIGARWATWVGVIALLFAIGFLLQWSIKNGIIGPRTQVVVGLLAGLGMVIAGLPSARRGGAPYLSRVLAGGGLAVLYLSLWAAFHVYGSAVSGPAERPVLRLGLLSGLFVLFLWVPIARAWEAREPASRLDLGLVIGHGAAYFAAVYMMLEEWRPLLEASWAFALGALYMILAVRFQDRVPEDRATYSVHLATGAVFLTLSIPLALDGPWVTLAWAAQGVAFVWVARQVPTPVAPWGAVIVLTMAAVRVAGLDPLWSPAAEPVLNVTFGVHLAVVAAFAWAGWLAAGIADGAGLSGEDLRGLLWIVGAVILAVLLWREPTGLWPGALLTAEMLALAVLARKLESRPLLLATGGTAVVAVERVLIEDHGLAREAARSLVNAPLVARLLLCAALAMAARQLQRARTLSGAPSMARVMRAVAAAAALVALSVDWVLHEVALVHAARGRAAEDVARAMARTQVGLSALWTLYAAVMVAWGFVRSVPAARYAGLGLFGLTILKVFLVDLSELQAVYRIASFFVLGLVLLGVSYAYQRVRLKALDPGSGGR
jgi:uncharacterized membrane protein